LAPYLVLIHPVAKCAENAPDFSLEFSEVAFRIEFLLLVEKVTFFQEIYTL